MCEENWLLSKMMKRNLESKSVVFEGVGLVEDKAKVQAYMRF